MIHKWRLEGIICTYDGMRGAGNPWPTGRPGGGGGAPPPGRFGIAGAGRPDAGTGGGALDPPPIPPPIEPIITNIS